MFKTSTSIISKVLLLSIILASTLPRIFTLTLDLPLIFNPDEARYLTIILKIASGTDLNPHFFNYPSLVFYLHAMVQVVTKFFTLMVELNDTTCFNAPNIITMGTAKAECTTPVIVARLTSNLILLILILLVYRVTTVVSQSNILGVLATSQVAFSPVFIANSETIKPDTLAACFLVLIIFSTYRLLTSASCLTPYITGVCLGLATGSKYNFFLISLIPVSALFAKDSSSLSQKFKNTFIIFITAIGFFYLSTPYSIVDFTTFTQNILAERNHYITGHWGQTHFDAQGWYFKQLILYLGVPQISLIFLTSLISGRESVRTLIYASTLFIILYFALISNLSYYNHQSLIPILVVVPILFSAALGHFNKAGRYPTKRLLVITGLSLLTIWHTSNQTSWIKRVFNNNFEKSHTTRLDNRLRASRWLEQQPSESIAKIAIESYGPYFSKPRSTTLGMHSMILKDYQWYQDNHFSHLAFSSCMYDRFFKEFHPKYKIERERYLQLWERLILVRSFSSGGPCDIKIYKLN